jgi:hypothetical protein
MKLRRHLPRIVLAVAAAASVATSYVNQWSVEATATLASITIDDPQAASVQKIQAVATSGDLPPRDPFGTITVSLVLSAPAVEGAPFAEVDVELRADARAGEIDRRIVTIPPSGRTEVELQLPGWIECGSQTCSEDYTLTLRRVPAGAASSITVSGKVEVSFGDDGSSERPSGASLEVNVVDRGSMQ